MCRIRERDARAILDAAKNHGDLAVMRKTRR
jgi:hypothetical protein